MEEELNLLSGKIAAMTVLNRRLLAQNNQLKTQLADSERQVELAQERLDAAKIKVELALSRLPVVTDI